MNEPPLLVALRCAACGRGLSVPAELVARAIAAAQARPDPDTRMFALACSDCATGGKSPHDGCLVRLTRADRPLFGPPVPPQAPPLPAPAPERPERPEFWRLALSLSALCHSAESESARRDLAGDMGLRHVARQIAREITRLAREARRGPRCRD